MANRERSSSAYHVLDVAADAAEPAEPEVHIAPHGGDAAPSWYPQLFPYGLTTDEAHGSGTGASSAATIIFNGLPAANDTTSPVYYIIRGDAGLSYVNIKKHSGDYEKSILPLQWAIDSAIIELQSGTIPPTPLEQPFTQRSNEEQKRATRKGFIDAIDQVLVIAFWIFFAGVVYQIAGAIAVERATLLTTHLQAMGCLRSARVVSWHLSISLPYVPVWIIAAALWRQRIFTETNIGLVIGINLIAGFSLASWSLFCATPFSKSPQLAAIVTTGLAFILAILALVFGKSNGFAAIFTLLFPPSFFIFAIRAISRKEINILNVAGDESKSQLNVGVPMLVAFITIFIYPALALWVEHLMYDARPVKTKKGIVPEVDSSPPTDYAIEVKNLSKVFNPGKKKEVVAIDDLSLTIPRNGVFVILGSNGSGKSTFHGVISNIISAPAGTIRFAGGIANPPRGSVGVVPQKNVLFPELTCYQTVRLWSAIKRPLGTLQSKEDLEQLIVDCDLAAKMHARSGEMSGGQKRKLQLAVGLVGGSDILLVDEATSGVDPLSRRAIWRALNAVRATRTIVFTTHFLDEADLLGDDVAILAAPGKLLAHGPPVSLKTTYGKGYILHLTLSKTTDQGEGEKDLHSAHIQTLLNKIQSITPNASALSSSGTNASFALHTCDAREVAELLNTIEKEQGDLGIASYDTHGTSLEEVFLSLMEKENRSHHSSEAEKSNPVELVSSLQHADGPGELPTLSDGRRTSAASQALVIFLKRLMIAKRSFTPPLLAILALIAASCIPLIYMKNRNEDCSINQEIDFAVPLYLPQTDPTLLNWRLGSGSPVVSPSNLLDSLQNPTFEALAVLPGQTFIQDIQSTYKNLSIGGLSLDLQSHQALVAYEASAGSLAGPALLNLASNVIANQLRGSTGPRIITQYSNFPDTFATGTGSALKWLGFFGLGLAIFPAFATLYVTRERNSAVKAMQLSNGLTPAGLHFGHLLAELPVILTGSTILIVVWAAVAARQFAELGLMWFLFVLFGLASSLFSFVFSLFLSTPLVAFAVVGLYNLILFILYVAAYLLTLTYAPAVHSAQETHIVHYTMALLGPLPSILRAILVSVNLFSLRCDGHGSFSHASPGALLQFGAPILYLIVYIVLFLAFLIWVDSGYPLPSSLKILRRNKAISPAGSAREQGGDALAEAERVASSDDALKVLEVSKRFKGASTKAVDHVSFGVGQETLGLLGPNGAGKTTTFNIIRGGITPDEGDVLINGISIRDDTNGARVGLGLCPQFTAIDAQLTVRDHLSIYGRLKGLRGRELRQNITALLEVTNLTTYADRLASTLSGGNQRKLSLAIALMGNPSVLLIDEYSTGIDPATKRIMWRTLQNLAAGKAVVITTHSMEEAAALSNRVAILSGKLLAIGTIEDLVSRYPAYEIHLSCRTPESTTQAQRVLSSIFPDCRPADDVATRWEVPVQGRSLSSLFAALSDQDLPEYAVERLSLESVFLKTIRNNGIVFED